MFNLREARREYQAGRIDGFRAVYHSVQHSTAPILWWELLLHRTGFNYWPLVLSGSDVVKGYRTFEALLVDVNRITGGGCFGTAVVVDFSAVSSSQPFLLPDRLLMAN